MRFLLYSAPLCRPDWNKDWHQPRVDISIITKDRPQSLTRLLKSLTRARYYGDRLNMRINLEQSADEETMQIAQNFEWRHGGLFLHHRVIHGGLLPAVVESWYPATNNTYGLLLEDDVELSPMFYAWIKMTILRYQYVLRIRMYIVFADHDIYLGMALGLIDHISFSESVCINKSTTSCIPQDDNPSPLGHFLKLTITLPLRHTSRKSHAAGVPCTFPHIGASSTHISLFDSRKNHSQSALQLFLTFGRTVGPSLGNVIS